LHGFSEPIGLEWEFGGNIGESLVRCWPQRTRFYFWGFLRLCQFWWKSIKKCDRESTHRRTHWQTDANRFYDLYHAICYSHGTGNKCAAQPGHGRHLSTNTL